MATVTSVSATQITVTVTGGVLSGTPTVGLVGVTGSASLASGHAAGVYTYVQNGTDNVWVFNRPAFGAGTGQVQFRSVSTDAQSDDDFVDIPEVGRDTTYLAIRARVTATTPTTVTVRLAVADPYPQGANSASIAHEYTISTGAGTVNQTSPQLVTPEATLTEAAGTYVDYVVTRPAFATGSGRITFTATAAGRVSDSDAVDVPAQDSVTPECRARVTSVSATQVQVTVDGVAPSGSPTVHLVAITGSATLSSGPAVGLGGQASGTVWVFNRGAALGGAGQVQFRATLGSYTDDDLVEINEQGRDTVNLVCAAALNGTQTESSVLVRVTVTDPVAMGGTPYTLSVAAAGCSISPSDSASLANGGTRDFTITRPAAGSAAGRVVFTVSATGRTSDMDVVDVPAVAAQHAVFRMKLRKISFASGTYTVEVDVFKYDGGGTWTQIKSWTTIGPGLGTGTANCREFGSTTDITVTETTPGYGYEQYPFIWTFAGSQSKEYVFNAQFVPNSSIAWGGGTIANQAGSIQITIPAMTNLVTVSASTPSGSGTEGQFWAQI